MAIGLFARNGFAGTSMRDIAAAAGCSVANVYHHFQSKEALWLAMFANEVEGLPAALLAAAEQPSGDGSRGAGSPLDRVERLVRAHVATSHRIPGELQTLFTDEGRLSAQSHEANRRLQHAIFRIYLAEVQLLVRAGIVRDADLKMKALNVLGVVNWHLRWMTPDASPERRRAEMDAIVSFVLRALDEREGGE